VARLLTARPDEGRRSAPPERPSRAPTSS